MSTVKISGICRKINTLLVPDFRSSTGLFKSLKSEHNLKSSGRDLFDASVYKDDTSTEIFHTMVREMSQATKTAQPTPFHHLLATLAHEGRLLRLYSQNIDGIDTGLPPLATNVPLRKVDGAWPKTVLLHGGLEKMVCVKCHAVSDFDAALFDGPVPPACPTCEQQDSVRTEHAGKRSHGIGCLRPRMVLYNEHNPDDEAIGSVTSADLRARPDALIVVGTTLKVPGVKRIAREMCKTVRDRKNGLAVWVNNDPPPPGKEFEWDLVVEGPCDEVARLAAMRKWYEEEDVQLVTAEEAERARRNVAQVVVVSPSKKAAGEAHGILTPVASPKLAMPLAKAAGCTAEPKIGATSSLLFAKAAAPKPAQLRKDGQPKAKPGPPKGWKKGGVVNVPTKKSRLLAGAGPKINEAFKVSKAVASVTSGPKAKNELPRSGLVLDKTPATITVQPRPQKVYKLPSPGTENPLATTLWKPLSTPRRSYPFAPVSPTEARNNSSPVSAAPGYSPLTINCRSKSLSELEMPDTPTRGVKRRSSASDSQETISPTGRIPLDLVRLLD